MTYKEAVRRSRDAALVEVAICELAYKRLLQLKPCPRVNVAIHAALESTAFWQGKVASREQDLAKAWL